MTNGIWYCRTKTFTPWRDFQYVASNGYQTRKWWYKRMAEDQNSDKEMSKTDGTFEMGEPGPSVLDKFLIILQQIRGRYAISVSESNWNHRYNYINLTIHLSIRFWCCCGRGPVLQLRSSTSIYHSKPIAILIHSMHHNDIVKKIRIRGTVFQIPIDMYPHRHPSRKPQKKNVVQCCACPEVGLRGSNQR